MSRHFSRRAQRWLRYVLIAVLLLIFVPMILQSWPSTGASKSKISEKELANLEIADIPGLNNAAAIMKNQRKKDPKNLAKKDWSNYELLEKEQQLKGAGEQGQPFHLPQGTEIKEQKEKLYRVNGFNALASDYLTLNRSIKDIRHPDCKKKLYIEELPTVSVILPFHNEHWSTLLRSVHSIVNRSPPELLKEVILADDFSNKDFLLEKLDKYVKETFPKNLVRIVRAAKREGLIRARLMGAKFAKGDVLIFLDSHSECGYNWLPPLLEPIAFDYKTVVCPFVDVIDYETMEYRAQDEGARGAFDWELYYKRLPLLPEDRSRPTEPFKSPVMAGGYFAITQKWFWELGGYDEGLDIWGGEQYELSFKLWQCGGQMVDAPCSRVGHIYRRFAPFPNPGVGDFVGRNYKRVAEVWMDEYKEFIYNRRPHYRSLEPGDLTKQKAIREKLQCKSFKWFMENIAFDLTQKYPPVDPPDAAQGEIRNTAANKCVDTRFKGHNERFDLQPCVKDNPKGGGEQYFIFTWHKDIRPNKRNKCFDVSTSHDHSPVVLFPCHGMQGNQLWKYRLSTKQLFHPVSNLCLDCDPERSEIFMSNCDVDKLSQKWQFENLNRTVIEQWQ